MMRPALSLVALVAACTAVEEPVPFVDESVDLSRCEMVTSEPIAEPWSATDGMAVSADLLALSVLGQWRGNFEDIHGEFQPASLHMVPSDAPIYRVEYEDEAGSCGVFAEMAMDVFLDVPCLVYGDIPTTITVSENANGVIAFNKLDAPRNLLDRPEFEAALLVGGTFEDGVLDVELMWEGRNGETEPAGRLSGALQ